jgi:hypothetical protein
MIRTRYYFQHAAAGGGAANHLGREISAFQPLDLARRTWNKRLVPATHRTLPGTKERLILLEGLLRAKRTLLDL